MVMVCRRMSRPFCRSLSMLSAEGIAFGGTVSVRICVGCPTWGVSGSSPVGCGSSMSIRAESCTCGVSSGCVASMGEGGCGVSSCSMSSCVVAGAVAPASGPPSSGRASRAASARAASRLRTLLAPGCCMGSWPGCCRSGIATGSWAGIGSPAGWVATVGCAAAGGAWIAGRG